MELDNVRISLITDCFLIKDENNRTICRKHSSNTYLLTQAAWQTYLFECSLSTAHKRDFSMQRFRKPIYCGFEKSATWKQLLINTHERKKSSWRTLNRVDSKRNAIAEKPRKTLKASDPASGVALCNGNWRCSTCSVLHYFLKRRVRRAKPPFA